MLRDQEQAGGEEKTVLVLDANQRSALAVTRSLGRKRHIRVITADASTHSLAGNSRYSSRYLRYPCPFTRADDFVATIDKWRQDYDIDYLQPTTEVTSRLLLAARDQLVPAVLPFPDLDTVLAVSDKNRLTRDARRLGVPVPDSRFFESLAQWDWRSEREFPLIIKPALSRVFDKGRWISTTVRKVDGPQELEAILQKDSYLQEQPFMVQEFIPGHGGGIFALAREGETIARFAHERLREKPPRGGVSVLCRSAAINRELSRHAETLLKHYRWSGVAMVEFRITAEGKPYLMEINTRFWGSLQLSIDCGVDFPCLLFETFMSGPSIAQHPTMGQAMKKEEAVAGSATAEAAPDQPGYHVGRQLRWYLGDLDNLLLTWKDRQLSTAAKLRRLADFLAWHRRTRHEIFRLEDPAPALFELKSYVDDLRGAG